MKKYIIFFIGSLMFTACINEPDGNEITIKTGTSFGECKGYCILEATITSTQVIYVSSSWDKENNPDKTENIPLSYKEWEAITETIDMDEFEELDETIGCPDCADGGSEWIEIILKDRRKKVTFEYEQPLEGTNELLKILRIIRNRYNTVLSDHSNINYSNSFETLNDTIDWTGITRHNFVRNPAPNGGEYSLKIGGGCMRPAATIIIKGLNAGFYKVSFWAKVLEHDKLGSITILTNSNDELSSTIINSNVWTKYESDQLYIHSSSELFVNINIGGIIPEHLYLDNLKMFKYE